MSRDRARSGPSSAPFLPAAARAMWPAAVPAAVLLLWWLATRNKPASLVPPPAEVWTALRDLAVGGIYDDAFSATLLTHVLASMSRVYGGFLLAAGLAIPLGLLIGRVSLVRVMLEPTLQILRPVPVTAWLPLAMILFGIGPRSAFFLVFLGAFYPILVNTVFGVRSVDQRLFEAASMLGASSSSIFPKVVLPASLPSIFTGLRLGPRLRLGGDRGGRDDRRADRTRRHHHGGPPALAHRDRDRRHGRHRHRRVPVGPARAMARAVAAALEPRACLRAPTSSPSMACPRCSAAAPIRSTR